MKPAERSFEVLWPARVAMFIIMYYQGLMRPMLLGSCKHWPSCSTYCVDALRTHGLPRGVRLTIGRLSRCHPFAMGGYDPVPEDTRHSRCGLRPAEQSHLGV